MKNLGDHNLRRSPSRGRAPPYSLYQSIMWNERHSFCYSAMPSSTSTLRRLHLPTFAPTKHVLLPTQTNRCIDNWQEPECPHRGVSYGVSVEDIFEVEVSAGPSFDKIKKLPNKVLLLCGTRSSNLLRHLEKSFFPSLCFLLVPGYMFGRAIVCFDAAAEAARYGFTAVDRPEGFLVLAVASLGEDVIELTGAPEDATELEEKKRGVIGRGRKKTDESEYFMWNDVKVSCGKLVPSEHKDSPLEYNECVVYDLNRTLHSKREQLGRSPSRVEMFDACFTDLSGNPSCDEVGTALDKMKEIQSKLPPDSIDPIGQSDTFSKVMGKDPRGRVRMAGLGVSPSDISGDVPSRSTCYRMVLENQVALARMEEKVTAATNMIASLQQKMQQNASNVSTARRPVSPSQSSNSINLGHTFQVGDAVLLKSLFNSRKAVAKGWVRSVDPNHDVGGKRLGLNWCEVQVSVPIEWEEDLIRPYSNLSTIGDAIGACIAWPRHLVTDDDDD